MARRMIEVETERDTALALAPDAYRGPVLRIRCRHQGERRWQRFLLVPDDGEGYTELEAKADDAARAYLAQL